MTRLIVAVDGNVNTGKTTLVHDLIKDHPDFVCAEEYSVEIETDAYDRQIKYLLQDEKRIGNTMKNIIMDRSILSLCAYVYWLYKGQGLDIRTRFYSAYIVSLASCQRIPNMVVLCYQEKDWIKAAYSSNKDIKGTDSLLVDDLYLKIQDEFYKSFQEELNDKVICYDYRKCTDRPVLSDSDHLISPYEFLYALQKAMGIEKTECIYSIDGISAVGKSSLCQALQSYGFEIAKEIRNENNTRSFATLLDHQVDYFRLSVERYKLKNRQIVDNGFLENIAFTFHMANKEGYGLSFVESYLKQIRPYAEGKEINQLFFLCLDREEVENRRDNDLSKNRKHFSINIEMHSGLTCMAKLLSEYIPSEMIVRIDASKSKEEVMYECLTRMHYNRMKLTDLLDVVYNNREVLYHSFDNSGACICK